MSIFVVEKQTKRLASETALIAKIGNLRKFVEDNRVFEPSYSLSKAIIKTIKEWRGLGFYYELDEDSRQWVFIGSSTGLERLARLFTKFAGNPKTGNSPDFRHFGPYLDFKVATWHEPIISKDSIRGPLANIRKLGRVILKKIKDLRPGEETTIDAEFSARNEYSIKLILRRDPFDPIVEDQEILNRILAIQD